MHVCVCLNSKEKESLKAREMEAREVRADSTAHGFQTHKWNEEPEFWHHPCEAGQLEWTPCIKLGFSRAATINKNMPRNTTPAGQQWRSMACLGTRMCGIQVYTPFLGSRRSRQEMLWRTFLSSSLIRLIRMGKPTRMSSKCEITNHQGDKSMGVFETGENLEWWDELSKTVELLGSGDTHSTMCVRQHRENFLNKFSVWFISHGWEHD